MFSVIKKHRFNSDLLSVQRKSTAFNEKLILSRAVFPQLAHSGGDYSSASSSLAEQCLTFAVQKEAASRLLSSRTIAECAYKNKYLCKPAQRRIKRHIDKIPDSSIVNKTQIKVFLRRGFHLFFFLVFHQNKRVKRRGGSVSRQSVIGNEKRAPRDKIYVRLRSLSI
jgi:hypothetical protein